MTAAASTAKPSAAVAAVGEESVGSEGFSAIDRMSDALVAQVTGGLSPAALALAFFDWSIHLASAPGKRAELVNKAERKTGRLLGYLAAASTHPDTPPCIEPLPGDYRFAAEGWKKQPYTAFAQAFLLNQQWWHNVTHEVPGVTPHHEHVVSFVTRQLLDMFSPSNHPLTNPEVVAKAIETGGANFIQGWRNFVEDATRTASNQPPVGADGFISGKDVAVTRGKVVYRNHLIELIQYAPTTDKVRADPDRPGLDHEVLHPRSLAGEFTGPLPGGERPHGFLRLLAQSGRRRSRPHHGRLSALGRDGRARRRQCHRS